MKVLGIDYGEKKIGIAISDELGLFARGLCTLVRKNVRADLQFLREIIDREKVSLLVLGLPLKFDGSEGIQCEKVRRFAGKLEDMFHLPVIFVDEVLSTEEAREVMALRPRVRGLKREEIDRIAAAIILQRYLDQVRG